MSVRIQTVCMHVRKCCMIKENDQWVRTELTHEQLLAKSMLSHGICPACYAEEMAKLKPKLEVA